MRSLVYHLVRALLAIYFTLYHRVRVEGREQLPRTGGVIIAPNHASFLDPPLMGVACTRMVDFMARDDLFHPPWFARLISYLHAFPVNRDEVDFHAMREAVRRLRAGRAVVLFPEGTRSPDGALQPPKVGLGFLALVAKVPIIPVAINGTERAFGKRHRWIKPHPVTVQFGPPIDPARLALTGPKSARYHTASSEIMQRIAELKFPGKGR